MPWRRESQLQGLALPPGACLQGPCLLGLPPGPCLQRPASGACLRGLPCRVYCSRGYAQAAGRSARAGPSCASA